MNDDIADQLSNTSLSSQANLTKELSSSTIPPHHPFDTSTSANDNNNVSNTSSSYYLSPDKNLPHQQSSGIQRRLSTGASPHGDGTASDTLVKTIDQAHYVTPAELTQMLQHRPLLIDVRYQPDYDSSRIRNSIHVNMPTLLLKRYRRGTVSNFNLESFITTPQGIYIYTQWLQETTRSIGQQQSRTVVVYDDYMDAGDKTTSAWTLVGALTAFFSGDMDGDHEEKVKANVVWLQGGFVAFEQEDAAGEYLERQPQQQQQSDQLDQQTKRQWMDDDGKVGLEMGLGTSNSFSRPNDLSSFWNNGDITTTATTTMGNGGLSVPKVVPALSRSATTFSSAPHLATNSNMQRRSSLFTLDTTNVRNKHRSPPQAQTTPSTGLNVTGTSSTVRNPRRRRQDRHLATTTTAASASNGVDPIADDSRAPTTTTSISKHHASSDQTLPKTTTGHFVEPSSQLSSSIPPNIPASPLPPPKDTLNTATTTKSTRSSPQGRITMAHQATDDYQVDDDDDEGLESEQEPTPMTENEYAFIVSAIVPDFLYLGPEISTVEQMQGLEDRSIQRILNMAEEYYCFQFY
ncbi:hypothetical protein [Absidia glauca]|uniref:Rhodanese domain-containing protein n=1 Tax=Absidia glauca TaxID=4829 RepID=A0A163MLL7_ABSGL|nr:hypothetical protein [Absidia glauca]